MEPVPGMEQLQLYRSREEQLAAGRDLSAFLHAQLERAEGRAASEVLCLKLAIVGRAATTLDALLVLVEQGYSEQAEMLVRPIFEAVVDAHWVRLQPEEAKERLKEHRQGTRAMVDAEHEGDAESELDEDVAKRPPGAAKKHWSGIPSIYKRTKAMEGAPNYIRRPPPARIPVELWFDWDTPKELRWFDQEHNVWANWLLHGSSAAFDAVVKQLAGGAALVRFGQTDDYVQDALFAAAWLGARLVWLAIDQAPPDNFHEIPELVEEQKTLFANCIRTLTPVSVAEMLTTGDLDPCPCGSGRPSADCHKDSAVRRHLRAMEARVEKLRQELRSAHPDRARHLAAILKAHEEFMAGLDERQAGRSRRPATAKRTRGKRRR